MKVKCIDVEALHDNKPIFLKIGKIYTLEREDHLHFYFKEDPRTPKFGYYMHRFIAVPNKLNESIKII